MDLVLNQRYRTRLGFYIKGVEILCCLMGIILRCVVQERGQVMACVNFLGLNNELYCSHLQLKLRILEMGVQASLSDLRDVGQTMALSVHAENAAQLMRWIYDLVVLDPNEDTSKKTSTKVRVQRLLVIMEAHVQS